jgi:hypothetical protein
MNSTLHYKASSVEELISDLKPWRDTVLVTFPYNDYATYGKGGVIKTKTGSPQRHLKLITDKKGSYVRFDGRKWDITGVKALVKTNDDGSTYRHLMVQSIQVR